MKPWEIRRIAAAVLMPNRCPFCDNIVGEREFWCSKCFSRLRFIETQEPPPQGVDGISAVCLYTDKARDAVLRMKSGFYRYSIDAFAVLIAENAAGLIQQADVITAIPSSRARCRELGYYHSEEIARMVSRMSGKPFLRTMKVTDAKREQKSLDAEHRRENMAGAFSALPSADVLGKTVLVIDDVCTTGSTLAAAAKLLRGSGAASVTAAVFARTPRR